MKKDTGCGSACGRRIQVLPHWKDKDESPTVNRIEEIPDELEEM